ncbi:MAG: ABC transporter ATP-binding protein [Pseudobutyrivibrio sp.]|nr:ABC transporter ATP-binding protein [Pseudobutyrivibrio sp.]
MKENKSLFYKVSHVLTTEQKWLSLLILILTCVGSLLEMLGVSIIIPVVNLILSPDDLYGSRFISWIPGIENADYRTLVVTIIAGVVALYIVKNSYFAFLCWFRNRFSYKIQRELSVRAMAQYMSRGYEFFLNRNYGQLERGVDSDCAGVFFVVNNAYKLISDILTVILIATFLLITDWKLTIIMGILACICMVVIYFLFNRKMYGLGEYNRAVHVRLQQDIMQSIHGIKDVLTLRKQRYFVEDYQDAQIQQQKLQIQIAMAVECPTYVIEGMVVSGIMIAIAFEILTGADSTALVESLAAMAVGAFRILPYLGKVVSEVNTINQYKSYAEAAYAEMVEAEEYAALHPEADYRLIDNSKVDRNKEYFHDKLELKDLVFAYQSEEGSHENVLNGINMDLKKGESVALIGPSGAGKSTMVDVLLGLLVPQSGSIIMDGANITERPDIWSKVIGYVPQSVFLYDTTIRQNIAFGEASSEIDEARVLDALEKANLKGFVESLPEGLDTTVGDRGMRLSGGQRQRIAIARALYHNPEILVLDEATSALDNDTEAAIMGAIESLQGKMTMVIVAHRLTTVRNCDRIYEVNAGQIREKTKAEVFGE